MRDLTESELDITTINSLRSRYNMYEDVGSLVEWICSDEWTNYPYDNVWDAAWRGSARHASNARGTVTPYRNGEVVSGEI